MMEPSSLDARGSTASDEKDDYDEKNAEKKPRANLKNDAADEKNQSAPAEAETAAAAAAAVAAESVAVVTAPRFPSQRQQRRRRRRKEPPPGPVRPLSAYNYFFRDERERWLAERETQGSHTEKARELFSIMGKAIAQRWKSLNAEEVAKYDRIAEQDRERYQRERKLYLEEKAQSRNSDAEEQEDLQPNQPSASAANATDSPAKKKRAATAAIAKDSVKNRPKHRKLTDPSNTKSKRTSSPKKDSSADKSTSLEDTDFHSTDATPAGSNRGQPRAQLTAAEGAVSSSAFPQTDFHLSQLLSEALARHQTAHPTFFTAAATEAAAVATATAPFVDSLPANALAWTPFAQGQVDTSTSTRIARQIEQDPQLSWHRPLTLPQPNFATATTSSSTILDQQDRTSHELAGSQSDLIRALLTRMEEQRQLSQLEQQQQQLSQQHQRSELEELSQRSMPPLQQLLPQATQRQDASSRGNPQSLPLEESLLLRAMLNQNHRPYTLLTVPLSNGLIPAFYGSETVWPGLPTSISGSQQQHNRHEEDQDITLDPIRAESTRGNIGGNVDHFPSLNEIIAARLQAQQHGEPMQEVPYHRPHPLLANSSISSLLHRQLEENQAINTGVVAALESSYMEQLRQKMIQEQQTLRQRDSQQQRVEENILQIVARLQQEREQQHLKDQSSPHGRGR